MNDLVIRELQGRNGPEDSARLQRWRDASPENDARFLQLLAVWELTGSYDELTTDSVAPLTDDLISRARGTASLLFGFSSPSVGLVASVACALIIGAALGWWATRSLAPAATTAATAVEFATGSGEMVSVALEDGSVVRLGPRSRLRTEFRREERRVVLDGRAFFAVAPLAERPFEVQTRSGLVRVTGTRFELDSRGDGLRLLVVDGQVVLTTGEEEVALRSGESATSEPERGLEVEVVESPARLLDWTGGFVAFENTPLHQAIKEIEARLGIRISIEDPTIADRTVSVWFGEADREQVGSVLCRIVDALCHADGGVLHMHRKP